MTMVDSPAATGPYLAATSGVCGPKPLIDWVELNATLNVAEQHAAVGTALPEMSRFSGIKRRIVRFVARCVLNLSRFLTQHQRLFNATALNSMRDIVNSIRQLEQAHRAAIHRLEAEVTRRLRDLEKNVSQVRMTLPLQERRINVLLEEARRRLPAPFSPEQLQTLVHEEEHSFDALYVAFEDQFRGSREEIKERLAVYIPVVKEAAAGTVDRPLLDIGCGRGEWLELLRGAGLKSYGLDINRVLLDQCRELGLDVRAGDLIAHLRGLPDSSLGAITGFHIIEHLPFPVLVSLFDECVRVLKPGGVAIFESPNPENVLVGSCNFYLDPTHQKPLVPLTIQFLAEQRGLVNVELMRLKQPNQLPNPLERLPEEHPLAPRLNPLIDLASSRLYCAGDFAIVAHKAK